MVFRVLALLHLVLFLASCATSKQLCPHVRMEEGKLKLNANEKVLVCGTDKDAVEGWRDVPLPQAEYQIKVLLQNKGYLHPRFERDHDDLKVWSGPLEKTKSFTINGATGILNATKKRQIVGQPMTPEKLDEVKNWADTELKSDGYACPSIDIQAQAWDNQVIANIQSGQRMRVAGIDYAGLEGLDKQSLARHQAMQPGDWYDARETQLTASRMLNDALFQTAYFTNSCHDDKVDLHLVTAIGKPHIFRFGVGASTEEFPFTQVWFKDARLDDRASSFTATLYASPKRQSLEGGAEYYRLPWSKRSYLGPRFLVSREKESSYEFNRASAGADLGRNWDQWKTRLSARVGPTVNFVNTVIGVGPANLKYISWDGSITATSHDYELFTRDQYKGWQGDFFYRGQRKGIGSPINVDRYQIDFKNLWNMGNYGPPLFVLGARVQAVADNATATDVAAQQSQLLPVEYREFFGGDDNLRGFNRKSLANGDLGYLTALYLGLELRLIAELPYRLEPFLLYDMARLGDRRFTLDRALFLSQGFGLRWPSPFGTLRGSLARGMIWNGDRTTDGYKQEWVAFVSFGQEF